MNRRLFLIDVGVGVAVAPLVAPSMCHADETSVHRADDVKVLASWVLGRKTGQAFKETFEDREMLTRAKDIVCYTDVPDVKWPKELRPVPYDFIQSRLVSTRHSRDFTTSGIVITGSIAADPPEESDKDKFDALAAGERCYYVEVGIGLRSHWIKFVVSGAGEKLRAKEVSHKIA
jgi:hypothetical protein